ncbi:uncharacterized protein LOC106873101 isoform X2 [Octopus bimaculoides]|uniref:SH3 and multiple ankyrin repeat domains protein 2 n=1 Tax=Octopus bimaculoides TaxID=37653 RepID=A0A0L8H3L6_OCTBM|nr:uncharacterized protein LOC106873101 isoform X2 [Octopus bimaculoides]|eukprot:XP_014775815.1 PREDICTED: uncharacterized protein LOC106873101 isoform X2 [Octopus bimaculoides]
MKMTQRALKKKNVGGKFIVNSQEDDLPVDISNYSFENSPKLTNGSNSKTPSFRSDLIHPGFVFLKSRLKKKSVISKADTNEKIHADPCRPLFQLKKKQSPDLNGEDIFVITPIDVENNVNNNSSSEGFNSLKEQTTNDSRCPDSIPCTLDNRVTRYVLPENVEEEDSGRGVSENSVSDIDWQDKTTSHRETATSRQVKNDTPINYFSITNRPSTVHDPPLTSQRNSFHQQQPHMSPWPLSNQPLKISTQRKISKPSGEFILVGQYESRHEPLQYAPSPLSDSRGKYSSMPSLAILGNNSKEEKKLKKILKKEKKKEEKRMKKDMKNKDSFPSFTLPHNTKIHRPYTVYEKPRPEWKLTPVPISIEEPLYAVPIIYDKPKIDHYASSPDLLRLQQIYNIGSPEWLPQPVDNNSNYAPRAVTLRKTPNGYGFVLRGAKSDLQFLNHVSNNSPAVQYLDTVDVGSAAEKAGLRAGDFILEINDENVTRASHEHVVKLIKNSGNMLRMTVLTVKPTDQDKNAFVHEDGSFTLPSRRRQAPEPPRRDPSTSLSFSKAKSKSFAEGMAEIEKLDQTLAEYEVCESPSKENSYGYQNAMKSEIKTASIRAAYAKKRLSNIEIDNICSMEAPHKPDRLSPSEVRIKKYHKKTSSLEKSRSTPNLAPDIDNVQISSGNSSYSSNSSGPLRSQQAKMNASQINQLYPAPYLGSLSHPPPGMDLSGCRHSVAIGSSVHINSLPSRGKAYPVPPPVVSNHYNVSPKEHVPPPPQVITINKQNDQSVNSAEESTQQNSYESSFRPGTVAVFGNNKKLVTNQSSVNQAKSHKPQDSLNRNKAASNFNSNLNSVTKTVIADVHHIDQSQGTQHYSNGTQDKFYEPLPDYGSEGEDNLPRDGNGNIISVGSNLTKNRMSLAVPPSSSSSSSESFKTASTTPSFQNTIDPQIIPPPPQFCPPPPPEFSHAPPPPPPPPPPPSNQLCPLPPPPPQFSSAPLPESQDSQTADQGNELLNEIKRAAQERQNRCKDEIPEKTTPKPTSVNLTSQDKNQAEILQAVAKRRSMLENSDENVVVNQIEAQIHKAKKLQYSKYYFTGNRMQKVVKELPEENTLEVEENKQNTEENKPVVKENKPVVKENKLVVKDAKVDVKQKGLNEGKINSASSEDKPISKVLLKPKLLEKSTDKLPTESNSNKTTEKTQQNQGIKSLNGKVEPHVNDDSKKGQEDFLIKAEKARQRYLSRKSLGTNNETADKANRTATQTEISDKPNNINAHTETSEKPNRMATHSDTTDKPNSTATHTETIDKPNKIAINNEKSDKLNSTATNNVKSDKSYNIARVNGNKTYNTKKEPEPCVISHKTVEKENKINTDQTRHGIQNKNNALIKRSASKVHIEIKPALHVSPKPISGVSIKERIANLQNNNGLASNNSKDGVKLITVKGVTTGHSNTDPSNSSDCSTPSQSPYHSSFVTIVAPPPGFCDSDPDERATDELPSYPTLQTLPAPLSELSISVDQIGDIHPPDDSLSLISSLSTLSTLSTSSTEHPVDIVHPPPTSFQDGSSPVSTDQGFEESFIAAPHEFNEPLKKHNITKHSYQDKSIEEWLYMDVLEWLDSLKLTQYKTNFSHHCIDGKKLLNLNRNDYLMLGITQVSHRLNLEKAIKKALLTSKSCQKSPVTSKISSSKSH